MSAFKAFPATAIRAFDTMHQLYLEVGAIRSLGATPSDTLLAKQRQAQEAFHAAGGHDAVNAELDAMDEWLPGRVLS
jgi:hypothetical protein